MGQIHQHKPALLFAAISSRYSQAIEWAIAKANENSNWGSTSNASPLFDFTETSFYTTSMGADLKKQLVAFQLFRPENLAEFKITSNQWEQQYAATHDHPEERPLNIDPGYLTEAKLVLATTKDRDHRIYVGSGIYAEVTLHYYQGSWEASRWTYPDYQRADFHEFLTQCRNHLRSELRR